MSKVIVFGKQGSGKTTHIGEFHALHPGHAILDDWDGKTKIKKNTVVLTHCKPPYAVDYDQLIML